MNTVITPEEIKQLEELLRLAHGLRQCRVINISAEAEKIADLAEQLTRSDVANLRLSLREKLHRQATDDGGDSALTTDARCFRFWVREAACAPGALAKAIANCITEQDYRDVLIPMMQAADDAIEQARRAA